MKDWNEDVEKKILKKSRFTLTFRVVRILLMCFFLYAIYMMIINIFADKLNVGNKEVYHSQLVTEWFNPNIKGGFDIQEENMTPFGSKEYSYNLLRTIGKGEEVIGEVTIKKRLAQSFSKIQYHYGRQEESRAFSFSLPEHPNTGRKLEANDGSDVWKTLKKLPEGTVGELAVSTSEFTTPEELIDVLDQYDLRITWMPLYTGEFQKPRSISWSGDHNSMALHGGMIGLTGGIDHEGDYRVSLRIHQLSKDSIEESKKLMLKNMGDILAKSEKYYQRFLGITDLKEQFEYIQQEGFVVYGAVVTGPVKELLKLKDEPFIRGPQLGEVELWNWYE